MHEVDRLSTSSVAGRAASPPSEEDLESARRRIGRTFLVHPWLPLWAGLTAALLTLPSIGTGLVFDDYHAKLYFMGSDSPVRLMDSPLDLFSFMKSPEELTRLMEYGFLPWWTQDGIRAAFWRPLACATHWLDYRLWPDLPTLMHVHSILWYAAAAAAVTWLYRRLMGRSIAAGLAAVLFAVDDAHGMVVGFLSNRSDLPVVVAAAFCLIAHDKWRREAWRAGAVAGPALLLTGLLFKEAAVAICGFLAAYELFLCKRPWADRVRALLPYAVVVVAWRLFWSGLGYGIAGIALYVDPLSEPGRFITAVLERAPVLLLAQWTIAPSEVVSALSLHNRPLWWAIVILLGVMAVPLARLLRQDRTSQFWAAAMLLSVIPACAAFPMDRMLILVGLGAMPLIARFLVEVYGSGRASRRRPAAAPTRTLAGFLVAAHLVLAPLALPVRAGWYMGPRWALDQLRPGQALDASIAQQDLILVNPPEAFVCMESPLIWASEGDPMPRRMRILMSSRLRPVEVERVNDRTLLIRPQAGFLHGLADPLLRNADRPLSVGQRIVRSGMSVEITSVRPDGRPGEAAFRFDVPLEDPSLRWLQWRDGRYIPFTPPAVGTQIRLPGGKIGPRGFREE